MAPRRVLELSLYALNMCVGFEPLGCAQRIERKAFPQLPGSRLGPYAGDALDSELEEFAEMRAFWLGPEVWRREWDSNPR